MPTISLRSTRASLEPDLPAQTALLDVCPACGSPRPPDFVVCSACGWGFTFAYTRTAAFWHDTVTIRSRFLRTHSPTPRRLDWLIDLLGAHQSPYYPLPDPAPVADTDQVGDCP